MLDQARKLIEEAEQERGRYEDPSMSGIIERIAGKSRPSYSSDVVILACLVVLAEEIDRLDSYTERLNDELNRSGDE